MESKVSGKAGSSQLQRDLVKIVKRIYIPMTKKIEVAPVVVVVVEDEDEVKLVN